MPGRQQKPISLVVFEFIGEATNSLRDALVFANRRDRGLCENYRPRV
jgi:hypothetical protein